MLHLLMASRMCDDPPIVKSVKTENNKVQFPKPNRCKVRATRKLKCRPEEVEETKWPIPDSSLTSNSPRESNPELANSFLYFDCPRNTTCSIKFPST